MHPQIRHSVQCKFQWSNLCFFPSWSWRCPVLACLLSQVLVFLKRLCKCFCCSWWCSLLQRIFFFLANQLLSALLSLTLLDLGNVFSDFPLDTCKKTPPICYSNRISVTMYRLTLTSTCGTYLGLSICMPYAEAPCSQLQLIW